MHEQRDACMLQMDFCDSDSKATDLICTDIFLEDVTSSSVLLQNCKLSRGNVASQINAIRSKAEQHPIYRGNSSRAYYLGL